MQRGVRGADQEHHTDQVIDANVGPVGFINEGQEFVTEFNDGLPLLLPRVEKLLPSKVHRVVFEEVVVQDVDTGHEHMAQRLNRVCRDLSQWGTSTILGQPNNRIELATPITDACNTRVWEKTYNVNLESLKGGKNT